MRWFLLLFDRRATRQELQEGLSECACLSVMLKHDKLAFFKVISTFQILAALLKLLMLAMVRRKKKNALPAGRRSTTSGSRARLSQQVVGKHKVNDIASLGKSIVSAHWRPARSARPTPLPLTSSVTGEKAADSSGQPEPSVGGATHAALLASPSPRPNKLCRSSPLPWFQNHPNPIVA